MLHRDVKSLNILLSGPLDQPGRPPAVKLGDVGEAWRVKGAGLLLPCAMLQLHALSLCPALLRPRHAPPSLRCMQA